MAMEVSVTPEDILHGHARHCIDKRRCTIRVERALGFRR